MYNFFYRSLPAVLAFITVFVPAMALGQANAVPEYVPLAGIPFVTSGKPSLVAYLNAIFTLSIAIAAIVAVLRIVLAGFKYMIATDGWANKEEAKGEIAAVITGLIVLLLSYIILQQINPQLVELRILQQMK